MTEPTHRQTRRQERQRHFMANFEVASVLLFAAVVMGSASAVQAQGGAYPAGSGNSTPAQMTVAGPDSSGPSNRGGGAQLDAAFARADANGDGKLTRDETEHFPELAHRFEQFDTDRDGFLSRGEFNKAAGF